ncbi:uncharacterized protein LOC126899479 isoform X2 [Daktulosphaira vitifoliae]|uniref:uncharacterized protein LOC126899479 isoform X2 n=1 Tax=Daktulosphaira vitifoliae TaxID=58002 RepID=UPI0021AAAFC1|nr:uncharacterized protein LOC126899479 isoform X2 [Daktulosphaira vitifoliae]
MSFLYLTCCCLMLWSIARSMAKLKFCGSDCNDAGCNNWGKSGKNLGCDCNALTKGRFSGRECESYLNACDKDRGKCQNGSNCTSIMGRLSCDCLDGYYGDFCENSNGSEPQKKYPKNWSVYYRTKVRPGEPLKTHFAIDFNDFDGEYEIRVENFALATNRVFRMTKQNTLMPPKELTGYCRNMKSNDYPLHVSMCNTIQKLYGGKKYVSVFSTPPYFISKKKINTEYAYIDKNNPSKGKWGAWYDMKISACSVKQKSICAVKDFTYRHLVIDDEQTYCVPFVEPYDNNCKSQKRFTRADDFEIKMNVTNDSLCDKHLDYNYEWKIYYDDSNTSILLKHNGPKIKNLLHLSTKSTILVRATNKYGIYVDYNISIQVNTSVTGKLDILSKEIDDKALTTSETIQKISAISEVLLNNNNNNNNTSKFTELLKTIQRISMERNIVNIEHAALILNKIVMICSKADKEKMKPQNLKETSISLLTVTNYLFNYLRKSKENHRTADIERMGRITSCLKNIIDTVIRSVSTRDRNNNVRNRTRYIVSSYQNLADMTYNIEESLTIIGECFTIHHMIYEAEKYYESVESKFWTNVKDMNTLKNRSDLLSPELVHELAQKSNGTWGIKIFELDKKLTSWTSQDHGMVSNIKFMTLSNHGGSNENEYRGLTRNFNAHTSIHFNLTGTLNESLMEYTIRVPAHGSQRLDFDKAVVVFKFDTKEFGSLVVKVESLNNDLLIAWLRNRRPDIDVMTNEQYIRKITAGKLHKIKLFTTEESEDHLHYIGVFVNTSILNRTYESFDVKFRMGFVCMKCLRWSGSRWTTEGMKVGPQSNIQGHMHCLTRHFSMFESTVFVLPIVPSPVNDIYLFDTVSENMVCLILIAIIFVVYVILMVFSRIWDKNDIHKSKIKVLDDNYPEEDEAYLVIVHTGNYPGSGTTANVCIELHGTTMNSRPHCLNNNYYKTMQRSNDDWFLIFTPQHLGEIHTIRLWHDNEGFDPEWYCKRIVVIDVRHNKKYQFEVERWFSLVRPGKDFHYIIKINNPRHRWRRKTRELAETITREKHTWASIFMRHPRSLYTRCQRLNMVLCTVLSIMIASMVFYELLNQDEEQFLNYGLRIREVIIAIQSEFLELILTFGVYFCFEKNASITFRKIRSTIPQKNHVLENNLNTETSIWKKNPTLLIAQKMTKTIYYFPAHTGTPSILYRWNIWLITGWSCCFVVYAFSGFYIVLYGLKFGRVKSLCWLTAILLGFVQNVLIAKPFNIIFTSALAAAYDKDNNSLTSLMYIIQLTRYREKHKPLSQDANYLKAIRKTRERFLYAPLSSTKAIASKNRQIHLIDYKNTRANFLLCIVFISLSVCYLCLMDAFGNQIDRLHVNRLVSKHVEHIFKTKYSDTITSKNLKVILSEKLIKSLHTSELYNGEGLIDELLDSEEYDSVGWFNLYNSRLIGTGIRLRQIRINENGKKDTREYGPGWTDLPKGLKGSLPWSYTELTIKHNLFFETTKTDYSGYKLDLVGGPLQCKIMLNEYFDLQWLDVRTKNFFVEFHVFNAGSDTVTAVKINMMTLFGLSYKIKVEVETIPTASIIISWETYTFTLMVVLVFSGAAVFQLISLYSEIVKFGLSTFWIVYDVSLAFVIVFCIVSLLERLRAMEALSDKFSSVNDQPVYDDFVAPCRAHTIALTMGATFTAMSILRLLKLVNRRGPLRVVKAAMNTAKSNAITVFVWSIIVSIAATVGFCSLFSWNLYGIANVVLGRSAILFDTSTPLIVTLLVVGVLFIFNALIYAIFVKYHRLSRN